MYPINYVSTYSTIFHIMSIGGLSFTWHEFRYDMAYMVDDNKTLRITATHVTEFLRWSTTITNRLNESSSEYIKVSFTTKNLLKLFSHFMRDTLSDRHKIVMPETYTYGYDDIVQRPIRIEIHSTMEYQEEWDIKIIELYPEHVPVEQRLESKMKLIEKRFETKLDQKDKLIDSLITRIEKLENKDMVQRDPTTYVGRRNTFDLDIHYARCIDYEVD